MYTCVSFHWHLLYIKKQVMGSEYLLQLSSCTRKIIATLSPPPFPAFVFTGIAAILYECRLGCLEHNIPQETQDYISALHLMFSSFKTTMYAGAIPKWLRPVIPKPWEEFCLSWDGLFKFSMWFTARHFWPQGAKKIILNILVCCLLVYLYVPVYWSAVTTVLSY